MIAFVGVVLIQPCTQFSYCSCGTDKEGEA